MITLGTPVFKRYDLYRKMLLSAEAGEVKPDKYILVDNGSQATDSYLETLPKVNLEVISPGKNVGVSIAWNMIIKSTEDIRIICNDDIIFYPNTIKILAESFTPERISFPGIEKNENIFSCFLIPDLIVRTVGFFDENFFPAYFEDNDYTRRLLLAGYQFIPATCSYNHMGSGTLKYYSSWELAAHHESFKRNREYYIRKWGGLPEREVFFSPFNK